MHWLAGRTRESVQTLHTTWEQGRITGSLCEPLCLEADRVHVPNSILLLERLVLQEGHIGFFGSSNFLTSLVAGIESVECAFEEVGKEN